MKTFYAAMVVVRYPRRVAYHGVLAEESDAFREWLQEFLDEVDWKAGEIEKIASVTFQENSCTEAKPRYTQLKEDFIREYQA